MNYIQIIKKKIISPPNMAKKLLRRNGLGGERTVKEKVLETEDYDWHYIPNVDRESRSWKRFPMAGSVRQGILRIEFTVTLNNSSSINGKDWLAI